MNNQKGVVLYVLTVQESQVKLTILSMGTWRMPRQYRRHIYGMIIIYYTAVVWTVYWHPNGYRLRTFVG